MCRALVRHADSKDPLLMRRLEASVGGLGLDIVVLLAITASMKALMSGASAQRSLASRERWGDPTRS